MHHVSLNSSGLVHRLARSVVDHCPNGAMEALGKPECYQCMAVLISLHCALCVGTLCVGTLCVEGSPCWARTSVLHATCSGERAFQVCLANIADPMADGNSVRPNEGDFVFLGEVFVQGFVRQRWATMTVCRPSV